MIKLLPLGSIVKFKASEEVAVEVIIAGYFCKNKENNKVYDYQAVLYPLGLGMSTNVVMFNQNSIVEVVSKGYEDEEGKKYFEELPHFVAASYAVLTKAEELKRQQ